MSLDRKLRNRTHRRILRVRAHLAPHVFPRVSVFRSLKHIYAQVIDDATHATVASCSSHEFEGVTNKMEVATRVGQELAKRAQAKGVAKVVFDRGRALYHGRVKALADGLREGGLQL